MSGTLGREGTMLGHDEMWESNATFSPVSPSDDSLPLPSHCLPRIDEKVETSEGEQSPSSQIIIDLNVPKITQISTSDFARTPIERSVCSIPVPVPLAISGKSEEMEDLTKPSQDSKLSTKRHVRNKSIFQLPLQIEPAQQQESTSSQPPSAQDIQAMHDQIINRQLECYDIAIRDLAASSPSKPEAASMETLNPITIQALKSSETVHSDSFVDKGHRIMPDLLAGSKVAALAAAFGKESTKKKNIQKPELDLEISLSKNDAEKTEVNTNEEFPDTKPGAIEKPIRKKRKSLLAMQKLEPTGSQGSQGSQNKETVGDVASSSDSEEEAAYWGSAGMSKVLRQSTVIRKGTDGLVTDTSNRMSPKSLSLEDIPSASTSGSSNEDVTAPAEDVAG